MLGLDATIRFFRSEPLAAGAARAVLVIPTFWSLLNFLESDAKVDLKFIADHFGSPTIIGTLTLTTVYSFAELTLALLRTRPRKQIEINLSRGIYAEIVSLSEKHRHRSMLRLRDALSRYLWVEGQLRERLELGIAAEAAAAELRDKKSQIACLVDDMGWTLVALNQYDRAKRHLEHGLDIASELSESYWVSKAYRHLAGISLSQRNFDASLQNLAKAEERAAGITPNSEKIDMLAGIEYARTLTYLYSGDTTSAREYEAKTRELRKQSGDASRLVRLHALGGKIAVAEGRLDVAKDCFRTGLAEAEALGRRDEMIRNHRGLAMIYQWEANKKLERKHRASADRLSKDTPVPYELPDLELGALRQLRK
jgi:hypothetical protein